MEAWGISKYFKFSVLKLQILLSKNAYFRWNHPTFTAQGST
jgi:hypothetical protein